MLLQDSRRWTVDGGQKALMFCLLFSVFCLSGCGFHPLYGQKTDPNDQSKVFVGVKIDPIPTHLGQMLQNGLEDKLNPHGDIPARPEYRLQVVLNKQESAIGTSRDGTVSRYNVYLTSHYVLYRISDNKQVTTGDISCVGSYNNVTNAYFSTYISEQDSYKNGIAQLSDMYRDRIGSYLSRGAPVEKIKPPAPDASQNNGSYSPLIYNPNATPQRTFP